MMLPLFHAAYQGLKAAHDWLSVAGSTFPVEEVVCSCTMRGLILSIVTVNSWERLGDPV